MSYFSAFISLIEANGTSFPCVKPAPAFSAFAFLIMYSTNDSSIIAVQTARRAACARSSSAAGSAAGTSRR